MDRLPLPSLSKRVEAKVARSVGVPMRDGTVLYADVWRPAAEGRYPVLVLRTPYDKSNSFVAVHHSGLEPLRAIEAGYAVVVQDTRGAFLSDGMFDAFVNETRDGYDTIEWASQLPFSDGTVGMYGQSYLGTTQLLAATQRPRALRAVVPHQTASDYYEGWTYRGGAFQLGFALFWAMGALAPNELLRRQRLGQDVSALDEQLKELLNEPWKAFRRLPLSGLTVLSELVPSWDEWLAHPSYNGYWRAISIAERHTRVEVPAFHIGGWFHIFLKGTLENFVGMRAKAATERARANQRLLIGPWAHAVTFDALGEVEFGPASSQLALDMTALHLDWFNAFLGAHPTDHLDGPPVRLFLMGANQWRNMQVWPPEGAHPTRYHLREGGCLSLEQPDADEPADTFVYDPCDPAPSVGGAAFLPGLFIGLHAGPREQRAVEQRPDVLTYTTDPLQSDLEVTGPVSVTLHAATSAVDTDWTAKLVDVYSDGRSLCSCDGILRARYRDGLEEPRLLEPDREYRYELDLAATGIVFLAGHRIRLEISSSCFPLYDRNPNSGRIGADVTDVDFIVARQVIFHDASRPSYLTLPVVPNG